MNLLKNPIARPDMAGWCLVLAGLLLAPAAQADAKLAAEKNCMACHDATAKRLGPAFKDVAARYAGQKDAVDRLTVKILKGGDGAWGNIRMPANTQLNDAEARKLAAWVLAMR